MTLERPRLSPKQREFLAAAAEDGCYVRHVLPITGAMYWQAGKVKLRQEWGLTLRSKGLIEVDRESSRRGFRPATAFRITDFGRAYLKGHT